MFTFIFEAADDVGRWHGSAVVSKSVIQLHHVLRRLFSIASKRQRRRAKPRQVESSQELFLQAVQEALYTHVSILLQQRGIDRPSVPISQPWSKAIPLMGVVDGAALSTQWPQEKQAGKQQELRSLGAADDSQV